MDRENVELNGRTFRASGNDDGKGAYVFSCQPYLTCNSCYLLFLHSVSVSTENSPITESQDASISLPPSLFAELELVNTTKVGMGFTFYQTATLFPLPEGSPSDLTIGSSVIGALVGGQSFSDLQDPVVIFLRLTSQVCINLLTCKA